MILLIPHPFILNLKTIVIAIMVISTILISSPTRKFPCRRCWAKCTYHLCMHKVVSWWVFLDTFPHSASWIMFCLLLYLIIMESKRWEKKTQKKNRQAGKKWEINQLVRLLLVVLWIISCVICLFLKDFFNWILLSAPSSACV